MRRCAVDIDSAWITLAEFSATQLRVIEASGDTFVSSRARST